MIYPKKLTVFIFLSFTLLSLNFVVLPPKGKDLSGTYKVEGYPESDELTWEVELKSMFKFYPFGCK